VTTNNIWQVIEIIRVMQASSHHLNCNDAEIRFRAKTNTERLTESMERSCIAGQV
jgi:hypothetical protein